MTNLPPKLEAVLTPPPTRSPETWDALCREEAAELIAAPQYFAAVGFPQHFPPERILGVRIIRAFAARYPALVPKAQVLLQIGARNTEFTHSAGASS